ncbi:MAG: hypothetical protein KDE03_17640 [Rhodobacteraceae bacterium]|nr:hypothetical protein [Paracoccaceae bacterium]
MDSSDSLVTSWCKEFQAFRLGGGEELKRSDEELMNLTHQDLKSALSVVLEIANRMTNPDALKYLAAQHFEEVCALGSEDLLADLSEQQCVAVRRLAPHIWIGRLSDATKGILLKTVESRN